MQKSRFIPANSTEIAHPAGAQVAVVYTYADAKGQPVAIAYRGRRTRSEWYSCFQNEAQRQAAIGRFFAEQTRNLADRARWDAEKKAARTKAKDLQALAGDLAEACQAAVNAARANDDDGGACNFDSLELWLPGAREAEVREVMERLKLAFFRLDGRYIVSPPVGGQGFIRTRAAKAMKDVMEAGGWEVSVRYCMD